jgi:hypothetical protein
MSCSLQIVKWACQDSYIQDDVTEKAAEKKEKMSIKELCSPVLHFQMKLWVSVTFQMNLFTMIIQGHFVYCLVTGQQVTEQYLP